MNELQDNGKLVLIVDDDESVLRAFTQLMKLDGHRSIVAADGTEALERIHVANPDIVFMDISMPHLDGLATLKKMKEARSSIPVILITGFGTTDAAINAMRSGAFEYLTKPLEGKKIRELTRRVLQQSDSFVSPANEAQRDVRVDGERDKLIGNSEAMQEVYKLIGSISATPNATSVLVLGESGTGKELVARAIHAHSENAGEPFVAINCTVLPENLLESELFGHERGAFTGASERKIGKFEFARGGSIFLDEIGDITPELQKKLLRVLQERQCERLGGNASIQVRARFIAATNRDLTDEVRNGNFREDLFYRLNVASIQLPPLRERREDIRTLANYFLAKFNQRLDKSVRGFSDDSMRILESLPFRGNVRELSNLIERAVIVTKGEVISSDSLHTNAGPDKQGAGETLPITSSNFGVARDHLNALFEQQFIVKVLKEAGGNVTAAARMSGMTRQNFQRMMKKHGIASQSFRDDNTVSGLPLFPSNF